jgi:hypothetical protein
VWLNDGRMAVATSDCRVTFVEAAAAVNWHCLSGQASRAAGFWGA